MKKKKEFTVDLSVAPKVPDGFKIVKNVPDGVITLDATKLRLFATEKQQRGQMVSGRALKKFLKDKLVAGAALADFLRDNPKFIPEESIQKDLVFTGTVFSDAKGNKCYRVLRRFAFKRWRQSYLWCDGVFQSNEQAIGYADDVFSKND